MRNHSHYMLTMSATFHITQSVVAIQIRLVQLLNVIHVFKCLKAYQVLITSNQGCHCSSVFLKSAHVFGKSMVKQFKSWLKEKWLLHKYNAALFINMTGKYFINETLKLLFLEIYRKTSKIEQGHNELLKRINNGKTFCLVVFLLFEDWSPNSPCTSPPDGRCLLLWQASKPICQLISKLFFLCCSSDCPLTFSIQLCHWFISDIHFLCLQSCFSREHLFHTFTWSLVLFEFTLKVYTVWRVMLCLLLTLLSDPL